MSSYFWCHGPSCHEKVTTDRVRGSKGSKVLRTRKIRQQTESSWYDVNNWWNYFCSTHCQNDFWKEYGNQIRQIAPRLEPLETPIQDPKKEKCTTGWGHSYYATTIKKIDTESNVR